MIEIIFAKQMLAYSADFLKKKILINQKKVRDFVIIGFYLLGVEQNFTEEKII